MNVKKNKGSLKQKENPHHLLVPSDYLNRDLNLKPVPEEELPSGRDVLNALEAMASLIETMPGHEGRANPATCLLTLHEFHSISISEIAALLRIPVQFARIYAFLHRPEFLRRAGPHLSFWEDYGWLLKFILRLEGSYDPADKQSKRLDAKSLSSIKLLAPGPQYPVAETHEKILLGDESFIKQRDAVADSLPGVSWAYSFEHDWFLVFDAEHSLDEKMSRELAARRLPGLPPNSPPIEEEQEPLTQLALLRALCAEWSLARIGTPFHPGDDRLLVEAQRVRVMRACRGKGFDVHIPPFYRFSHVANCAKSDFAILKYALGQEVPILGSGKVRIAPPRDVTVEDKKVFAQFIMSCLVRKWANRLDALRCTGALVGWSNYTMRKNGISISYKQMMALDEPNQSPFPVVKAVAMMNDAVATPSDRKMWTEIYTRLGLSEYTEKQSPF